MTLVTNRAGEKICFEIALAKMNDDIREYLETLRLPTKQAFFTAYELAYEREMKSVWEYSKPSKKTRVPAWVTALAAIL